MCPVGERGCESSSGGWWVVKAGKLYRVGTLRRFGKGGGGNLGAKGSLRKRSACSRAKKNPKRGGVSKKVNKTPARVQL